MGEKITDRDDHEQGRHGGELQAVSVDVRLATAEDAPRIAELSGVLGYPVDAAAVSARLSRLVGRHDNAVLVAVDGDRVVGWIHGAEHELVETGSHCEILGLVVDSTHRKAGAGRRLVDAIERWAAARGLTRMSVRSNVARVESHPFYERLGYVRVKTQHSYRKSVSP
jgi:GNAT superfamily N-acetyltransferase